MSSESRTKATPELNDSGSSVGLNCLVLNHQQQIRYPLHLCSLTGSRSSLPSFACTRAAPVHPNEHRSGTARTLVALSQ